VTTISDAQLRRFYAHVGSNIRNARTAAGLSQSMLAERIGFTRAAVSNLESGRQRLAVHLLVQIADTLGVKPAQLLAELPAPTEPDVLKRLDKHIVHAPETAQDFVRGAVAQLVAERRREEQ
jgi:transcriptional regulator with XRE-family HTH domain